ncbi:hypothetical protein Taro_029539, partial [Colocasia esculenta]|nr:hypothetical protein [Colocasia esculenta]
EEEGRAWCRGVVDLAWSEEEVANRCEGPHWGSFFVKGRDYLNSSQSGRIGSSLCFPSSLDSFPCSPPPCVHACMICGRPGIEDPVGLPLCWCRDGSAHVPKVASAVCSTPLVSARVFLLLWLVRDW